MASEDSLTVEYLKETVDEIIRIYKKWTIYGGLEDDVWKDNKWLKEDIKDLE